MSSHLRSFHAFLVFLLAASPVLRQATAPRFEVATVKLSPPPLGDRISINLGTFQNGRLTFANVTLNDLLLFAYDLSSSDQLVGLDWTGRIRFDIEALAPLETPQPQLRLMMRELLAERLNVLVRREQRPISHLALVVAQGGPKVKPAVESPVPATQARGRIRATGMSMRVLAALLSRFERQLVVDRTDLEGDYEFALEWAPDLNVLSTGPATPPPDRPSLFTAVQEQLGLRLEGRRGPIDVLVVEAASSVPEPN